MLALWGRGCVVMLVSVFRKKVFVFVVDGDL